MKNHLIYIVVILGLIINTYLSWSTNKDKNNSFDKEIKQKVLMIDSLKSANDSLVVRVDSLRTKQVTLKDTVVKYRKVIVYKERNYEERSSKPVFIDSVVYCSVHRSEGFCTSFNERLRDSTGVQKN